MEDIKGKFKVGDRVKIIRVRDNMLFKAKFIGKIAKVTKICNTPYYYALNVGYAWAYDEIKLCKPKKKIWI